MSDHIGLHEGRQLFGLNPEGYDDARPDYPNWIFDRLRESGALFKGAATLEIGAGTGKATRRLLEHGVDPLTIVEPDTRFAQKLSESMAGSSAHCRVVHESFEEIELPDHRFDLVAAATSFHWIDPTSGLRKAKRVLRQGGFVALFWNVLSDSDKADPFHDATQNILSSATPPEGPGLLFALDRKAREADARAAGFHNTEYLESRWSVVLNTSQVRRLYESFSHIQRLDADSRVSLLDELAKISDTHFNGKIVRNITTPFYLFS